MPATTPPRRCARCSADLPPGATECPRCLLRLGLPDRAPSAEDAPAPPPPVAPGEPPTIEEVRDALPDLEIESLLGRGGMGSVFKARQRKLQRTVALKVLPRALGADPAFAERFLREARALARLSHPGIVAVHDSGEAGGLCWLVMEYVEGLDLRRLLRSRPLEPREALAIARDLCDALQYAHDEGVVHRDIKPENVLVDAKGRVKVADFGLAKLVHPGPDAFVTRADQVMGTPHYMAPEQIERPREVDHRADIFSLGVVLYEMLTGSLPRGNFEPPSRRVQVDVRLDEIVLKALEREPERRYQQALEVRTDVDHVAVGKAASTAAPRPPVARASKRDWLAGPRVLAPLALLWIALAALWNVGPFPFGVGIPFAILAFGAILQSRVRADAELSAAIEALPPKRQALQVLGAVASLGAGLVAVAAGHFLHWERGTRLWAPSASGSMGAFEAWRASPRGLLALAGDASAGFEPVVSMQRAYSGSSADAGAIPPFLLMGAGLLLVALAIASVVRVPGPEDLRKRSNGIGLEIASYALGALLCLWVGGPILALRSDTTLEGVERRVVTPLSPADAASALRVAFIENDLRVDVEQRVAVIEGRTSETILEARIERAQSDSPFERWSTSFRGPIRETPQVWATIVPEMPTGNGSVVLLRAGLYDATSQERVRAQESLLRLAGALSGI